MGRIILSFLVLTIYSNTNSVFCQIPAKTIAFEDKEFNNYLSGRRIPKVTGIIKNLSKQDIKKTRIEYTIVTPSAQLQVTKTCGLNADGSFELKLDHAYPYQQVWVDIDSLFFTGVYAHTDLFIELDGAALKKQNDPAFNGPGIKYRGHDGMLNEFTTNHILFKRDEQLKINDLIWSALNPKTHIDTFIKTYDSLHTSFTKLDEEYIQKNPSPYSWILKNERASNYYSGLCVKYWGTDMPPAVFEKVRAHKAYLSSNEGMIFYNYFLTYLRGVASRMVNASERSNSVNESIRATITLVDSLFPPHKSDFIKIKFTSKDPKEQKQQMETILPTVKTLWCKNVITKEYNNTVKRLASINKILNQLKPVSSNHQLGEPIAELPFGALLYKVDGIKADSLLALIKSRFKDRALLIDFWATWCAPCISEFPHSKRLSDESKDLPIEFIYLCTSEGSNMEKWKSKIAEFQLRGHHLFVEKKIESALMELLSLSGYPSYLLINTKGEYRADVIRPSHLTTEQLRELIK